MSGVIGEMSACHTEMEIVRTGYGTTRRVTATVIRNCGEEQAKYTHYNCVLGEQVSPFPGRVGYVFTTGEEEALNGEREGGRMQHQTVMYMYIYNYGW